MPRVRVTVEGSGASGDDVVGGDEDVSAGEEDLIFRGKVGDI